LSILVVGSLAYDWVETPFGKADRALGGAAVYFATAASLYSRVNLVGVVGEDFEKEHFDFLSGRGVDLSGLQVIKGGETFRWGGSYDYDLNTAKTAFTELNVFGDFHPQLPPEYRRSEYVFLANIDPDLQLEVLSQVENPKLRAVDTMNFWINSKRDSLTQTIASVDIALMNEAEARQFAGTYNLVAAAREILALGPKVLIVKKGEYGVVMFSDEAYFAAPAYPLETVKDPTGAGDTFAGGFIGYLAMSGRLDESSIRRAIVHGSVMASFTVEEFSVDRLKHLTHEEVNQRFEELRKFTHFGHD